jgi:N-acetylglutamate synthase-like GNAT family acetyltransferase
MPYEVRLPGGYVVSDDGERLDIGCIHRFLSEESYWAQGRSRALVERSVANSLCFGLYDPSGAQAGFARMITDYATTTHLQDVFVLAAHRGHGRGKALVAAVLAHPALQGIRRWTLSTRDAHALYAGFGFAPFPKPENQMARTLEPEGISVVDAGLSAA